MQDTSTTKSQGQRIALLLAFLLVLIGMVNTLPEIPGLQNWAREITGIRFFRISGFPTEYLFPPLFVLMMVIHHIEFLVSNHHGYRPGHEIVT